VVHPFQRDKVTLALCVWEICLMELMVTMRIGLNNNSNKKPNKGEQKRSKWTMETKHGLKCDWCGRFMKAENIAYVRFTPDSPISIEQLEHQCKKCRGNEERSN